MTPMLFLDIWNLFCCICVTGRGCFIYFNLFVFVDFICFATMVLKALIAIYFLQILPSRKKVTRIRVIFQLVRTFNLKNKC